MIQTITSVSLLCVYAIVTFIVFNRVYSTSTLVIDEEFHLRQGEHYCQGRFQVWDPKITTFPGLYLASALVLSPFGACTAYHLRLTSLVASIVNVVLIFKLRQRFINQKTNTSLLLETASLALLPPLYFFTHLYYTDVLSVTAVLLLLLASERQRHNWAAFWGFCAVLMRQTNIVWVGFVCGSRAIDPLLRSNDTLLKPRRFVKFIGDIIDRYWAYAVVMGAFIAFLCYNGSIVIGDKSAHEAAIHLPQLFYFIAFFVVFSASLVLPAVTTIMKAIRRKWFTALIVCGIMGAIAHYNTIVHPYLLADNRHYTFYLWNRFYGRWWFARYLPIPVYIVGGLLVWKASMQHQSYGYMLLSSLAILASIALQQLIEHSTNRKPREPRSNGHRVASRGPLINAE